MRRVAGLEATLHLCPSELTDLAPTLYIKEDSAVKSGCFSLAEDPGFVPSTHVVGGLQPCGWWLTTDFSSQGPDSLLFSVDFRHEHSAPT